MKDLKMFVLENCPYCRKALTAIDELKEEHKELQAVKIRVIEETKEKALADTYDYYYVPSFYLNEVKIHEGAIDKDEVYQILKSAL